MNIFKSASFTWWQFAFLKIAALAVGIVIGAHWPNVFLPYTIPLLIIAIVLGVYLSIIRFK